jgi:carbonic anhydrase
MPTGRSRWWPTTSRLTASSRVVPATRSEAWRSRSEKLRKSRLGTRGRTSKVRRSEEEITAATIERQPLWNDRKTDHGPFDIVGDVHVGEGSASGAVPCACDGRRGACALASEWKRGTTGCGRTTAVPSCHATDPQHVARHSRILSATTMTPSVPSDASPSTTEVHMAAIDELLEANLAYASHFDKGHLPMPPRRRVAIVTCMDARIVPSRQLGLEEGDAHVIRNAGGLAQDALRSLIISQQLLGTREVAVIHHTDCGMLTFRNEDLRARLRDAQGVAAEDVDFLPFTDVEQSVRDDVAFLRGSSLILHGIPIRGFVYDVRTGRLSEIASDIDERPAPMTL